jgi:N utilization substance protein B
MGVRRRGREAAVQVLYQLDLNPDLTVEQALANLFEGLHAGPGASRDGHDSTATQADEQAEIRAFTKRLVCGVHEQAAAIDEVLAHASRRWRVERMSRVDRNILRVAVYELRSCPDIPPKVTVNEAIEIAKRYGPGESPAFVNGVLDRALGELGIKPSHG